MTIASTIAAIVLMPLAISIYAAPYVNEAQFSIPTINIVTTLVLILIPVAIGMLVLAKSTRMAAILEKTASILGIVFIVGLVAKFFLQRGDLMASTPSQIAIAAILLGLVGFVLGYGLSILLGLSKRQSRTVSLETGIQNTPLSIAIIALAFSSGADQDTMLIFPTFYALTIVIVSAFAALAFRKLAD